MVEYIEKRDSSYDLIDDCEWPKIEIVETTVIVPPRRNCSPYMRNRYVSHSLAYLESSQPDILFVSAISIDTLRQLCSEAGRIWHEEDQKLEQRIAVAAHETAKYVPFETVTSFFKERIKIGSEDCWNWHRRWAPYRDIYIRLKGAIPEGALLRHSCNNRRCVNPNHLTPGTVMENAQDRVRAHADRLNKPARKPKSKALLPCKFKNNRVTRETA